VLREPVEAVEAVNEAIAEPARDETDGAAGEDPEFEAVPVDLHHVEGEREHLGRRFEPDRVGHRALDIVRRALQCPQRTLAHRMDAADIPELTEGADDLVEDIFQPEVRHQHWSSSPVNDCGEAGTRMTGDCMACGIGSRLNQETRRMTSRGLRHTGYLPCGF